MPEAKLEWAIIKKNVLSHSLREWHVLSKHAPPSLCLFGTKMKKYWLFFKNAAESELRAPWMIIMRLSFLTALVFVTAQLWTAIGHRGFEPVNIIWYLVMNEMLIFSHDSKMQKRVFHDIRSGNIGYSLIRPFSYLSQCLSESMGMFFARIPFLMLGGGIIAYLIGGGLPATPQGIPVVFALMILAGIFYNTCVIFIGMLGLYMQNTESVQLIFSKLMMLLGGLFFPLTIYPEWMQSLAAWTPFPWALYEVSRLVYEFSWAIAFNTFIHLFMWTAAALIMTTAIFAKLLKKVSVNGG